MFLMEPFSVLISIYKKENPSWFKEALANVFSQTVQPDEIVLVKDGPLTPELEAVIEEYKTVHPIFNIVENEANLGLGLALQKGVLACKNEIIARMDTDDTMPVDRFEKQLKKMEEGYDVVSCWSQYYEGGVGNVIAIKHRPEKHDDIVKLAHRRSPVCHAACFLRKSAVMKAGNYQHCPLYEDYHLWARMIMAGAEFYNIQEVLYYVRTSSEQQSRRSGWAYLKTELGCMRSFHKMGFYSRKDLFVNSSMRIVARLMPRKIWKFVLKKIWKNS